MKNTVANQAETMDQCSPFDMFPDISKRPSGNNDAWLLAVVESALDGALVVDQSRRIVLSNAESERIFERTCQDLVGQPIDSVLRLSRADQCLGMDRFFAIQASEKNFIRLKIRLQGVRADGEKFDVDAMISRVVIQGQPLLTILFREAFTPQAAASMTSNRPTSVHAVASQEVSEIEKKRVAKQIYDDLGQRLSVLKLDMDWLESSLPDANKLCPSRVAQMQKLLDNIIVRTKAIACSLRPPLLDDFGLLPAILWVAEMFQKRTSVMCKVESNDVAIPAGDPMESAVFRIVQEGLLNIERHAHATCASVRLKQSSERFEVLISDDGIGMTNQQQNKIGCFGLIAMQERIYTLGGSMSIGTAQPNGVVIHASIPLSTPSSRR